MRSPRRESEKDSRGLCEAYRADDTALRERARKAYRRVRRRSERTKRCVRHARGEHRQVKLYRAHGGCLGVQRRGKARQAAKMPGELQMSKDPSVPEWGKPAEEVPSSRKGGQTRRTETSKYPEEKKSTEISRVAASEKDTAQTGALRGTGGAGPHKPHHPQPNRMEGRGADSETLEGERGGGRVPGVPRDTRNPVGSRGDHPPRLNTAGRPIAKSTVREK